MQTEPHDPVHNDRQSTPEEPESWRRLADICRELHVPVRRGARWAQALNDGSMATKRPRPSGGSPEWWVSTAGSAAFLRAIGDQREIPSVPELPTTPVRQQQAPPPKPRTRLAWLHRVGGRLGLLKA
jgi:hypothetical protein